MDITDFRTGFTVVMFVIFIGIVAWAFSGRRKEDFEEAARLAVDDTRPGDSATRPPE